MTKLLPVVLVVEIVAGATLLTPKDLGANQLLIVKEMGNQLICKLLIMGQTVILKENQASLSLMQVTLFAGFLQEVDLVDGVISLL